MTFDLLPWNASATVRHQLLFCLYKFVVREFPGGAHFCTKPLCVNSWRGHCGAPAPGQIIRTNATPCQQIKKTRAKARVQDAKKWCRGRDSNPHRPKSTAPSRQRVYQFHHLGTLKNLYYSACVVSASAATESRTSAPRNSSMLSPRGITSPCR